MRISRPLLIVLLLLGAGTLYAGGRVAPYYDLSIDQGVSIPSKGDWMYTLNLVNDLGVIVQPMPGHKFLGFYELRYIGPGLRRQEGEKFSDRTMDHVFAVRHHWDIRPGLQLKTQVDYLNEKKRTGANEVWGQGLYDSNRYGLSATIARTFAPALSAEGTLQFHTLDFPNYTDLLSEFQSGGAAADVVSGKQNQVIWGLGGKMRYGKTALQVDYSFMQYRKQKVVSETVQADGTYYSGDLQRDAVLSVTLGTDGSWRKRVFASPALTLKMKTSNQNYQYFAVATSTVPVQYYGNYYGYAEAGVTVPLTLALSRTWDFSAVPAWSWRWYADRPARRDDGTFTDERQTVSLAGFSVGFSRRATAVTRTTFYYSYQAQSSNMRFEKYLPYNYSGQFFGIGLQYTY